MRSAMAALAVGAGLLLAACTTLGDEPNGSPAALEGEEWIVEDIAGQRVVDDARSTLLFGSDGRVGGNASCNRYFADYAADGTALRIGDAGLTRRACAPAVMDQERRFLEVLGVVDSYRIDPAGTLTLSAPAGVMLTARRVSATAPKTTYRCTDGSVLEASYPTTDTARIFYEGQTIDMAIAVSASGARYVGGEWEWWTKGQTEGTLSPIAAGEDVASAPGLICTAR